MKLTASQWKRRFDASGILTGKTKSGGTEFVAYCPNCEDPDESSTPSASFNFEDKKFHCFSCRKQFPFKELLQMAEDDANDRRAAKKGKGEKVRKVEPLPSPQQIERWHEALITNPEVLGPFRDKRGLSMDTIVEFKIGWMQRKKRFTIPIYGADGDLIDVRQYRMNAREARDKMISLNGHGGSHLYGLEALQQEEILLTEGELDRLTGVDRGFNAMTHTSGAKAWQEKWSYLFEGKTVFICYDDDDEGKQGAMKTALSLRKHNAKVYIIRLSIPSIKRADLTDYFVRQGMSAEDFREMMEDARVATGSKVNRSKYPEGDAEEIGLNESLDARFVGRAVSMVGTVSGKAASPSIAPKEINFTCGMDWGDKCAKCPMTIAQGNRDLALDPRDKTLLEFVDRTNETRDRTLLKIVGIPTTCPKVEINSDGEYTIEELVVIPSVAERTEEVQNPIERTVYNVGSHDLQVNKTMRFTGTSIPSPTTGRSVFMAWEGEEVSVDIDQFQMTPEIYRMLKPFQVDDDDEWGETPYEKMHEIAKDMSLNVTNIYGRYDLHMAYDLVWHSVMDFEFNNKRIGKGWLEMIVLGDTRTGKSEVATSLSNHYNAGVIYGAEAASFAGLIGGSAQKGANKTWGITWGIIPLNDRRLIVLDECGGLVGKNIIENMSSVRSSGIAEITKMGGQRTSARTRLIWIGNPVDGRTLEEMSRGAIDGILDMFKNPEDIARFDFAMSAAENDVPSEVINRSKHEHTAHVYTSEMCSLLVTWAWSRKADDIVFLPGVEDYIYQQAETLGAKYVSEPPLIQKQNVRVKLARMAVAVAARTFSTDSTGTYVLVGQEHVDTALRLLNVFYGSDSFGYKEHSTSMIVTRMIAERNYKSCKRFIQGNDRVWDTLKSVHLDTSFKHRDFRDFGGMQDEEATNTVAQLLEFGMLRRLSKGYIKMEAPLVRMVKELILDEERERLEA